MKLELAILNVLARYPDRHVSLDEIRRAVDASTGDLELVEQIKAFSALGETEIVRSGLANADGEGLQITPGGLSLLHSLEEPLPPDILSETPTPASGLIASVLTPDERSKIFELDLRPADGASSEAQRSRKDSTPTQTPVIQEVVAEAKLNDERTQRSFPGVDQQGPIESPDISTKETPDSVRQPAFGSRRQDHVGWSSRLLAAIASRARTLPNVWRSHLALDRSVARSGRSEGNGRGWAFVLLGLLSALVFAAAVVGAGQINLLRSDVASLERELAPLKERIAKLEQLNRANRESASGEEYAKAPNGNQPDRSALNLSQDEIQLIKSVIMPAAIVDPTAPAIKVGDNITGPTIPLPALLTDKIPKLLGAKFATRNGAIIIVGKDSRKADAVLGSN